MQQKPLNPQALAIIYLLGALALVGAIGAIAYRTSAVSKGWNEQFAITRQVGGGTAELLSALKDAEIGQRGYLLTSRDRYLQPFEHAQTEAPEFLRRLTQAARTRPETLRLIEQLRPLVADKLAQLKLTIQVQRTRGSEAALAIVMTDRGKNTMDEIRRLCEAIEASAVTRLGQQTEAARVAADRLGAISTAGSIALFGLLVFSSVRVVGGSNRQEELIQRLEKTERESRTTQDWLQTTLSSIGDGVIATDAEGKVVFLNEVAQKLMGWSQADAVGVRLEDAFVIHNEATGMAVENPVVRALREGRIVGLANHTQLTARDGREIPIEDSAAPIRDEQGKVYGAVMVFRDVTERKRAESAVEQSSKQFRLMADSAPVMVWITDAGGRCTWLNNGWLDFVGWTLEEELAREPRHHLHPGDRERCATSQIAAMAARRPFAAEYRLLRHDGAYRWVLEHGTPLQNGSGGFDGYIASGIDITDQKTVEEKLLRANEDLNQFAYAASHDLQEPLRMITSYSQLLVEGLNGQMNPERQMCVDLIAAGTTRMRELLLDLLAYTQTEEQAVRSPDLVDLNSVLDNAVANLKTAIAESGASVTSGRLPRVRGYAAHFAQLLQNLIGNGLKYRGPALPVIHISAVKQGAEWFLMVEDNGIGIDPQYHDKVFGVFKRLHGREISGTGIGLAICQRVVERYGGRIWVESQLGAGSKFRFTLPVEMES